MISFTETQALALISDPGTLKRGQELLKPAKWANLGRTDSAAWGDCAGSGSKPYLTGIDLSEPAFRCSCPSRVFPCKHGAGLLLLLARQPELFTGAAPPAWVEEWLTKRDQTQTKKAEKPTPAAKSPAGSPKPAAPKAAAEDPPAAEAPDLVGESPAAATSAVASEAGSLAADEGGAAGPGPNVDPRRLARMTSGAEDFTAWLEDLLRAGLATLDQQPANFWEAQAARLVDNQLPGLAAALRELPALRPAHADWPARLLARLGELYLLARAFTNLPQLSPEARADVLQLVGVNLKKEDLLATAEAEADEWQMLGQFRWEEDRLTARRTWLRGRAGGLVALMLDFAFGSQPFATALVPGGSYRGALAFYPGRLRLRAAPASLQFNGSLAATAGPPGQLIGELLADYAAALARQPWLREWPATLRGGQLLAAPEGGWLLRQGPLGLRVVFADETTPWQLLAASGGYPVTVFGEWNGQQLRLLSFWPEPLAACSTHAAPTPVEAAETRANAAARAATQAAPDAEEPGTLPAPGGTSALALLAAEASVAAAGHGTTPAAASSAASPGAAGAASDMIATVAFKKTASTAAAADSPAAVAASGVTARPVRVDGAALLRLALLGTRQSGEVIAQLPGLPAPASPEQGALLAAGTLALLRKAGYRPMPAAEPGPAPAAAELLPGLGPRTTERLRQLLTGGASFDLLPAFLDRLAAQARLVPATLLVPLLDLAGRQPQLLPRLRPVLGRRGHWLAAQHPEWTRLVGPETAAPADVPDFSIWESGTRAERLAWLEQRFAQDAPAARTLLLAALPTETAKTQEALLTILGEHLHSEAGPVLETLLRARGQDVRRLAAELLVQLPGAGLIERLWVRAAPLLGVSRRLLGLGAARLDITLPTSWNQDWLADGIEENNPHYQYVGYDRDLITRLGPAGTRLGNLLALLPPARWLAHLGLSPDELLAAALASEWAVPLLPALAHATLLHHDAEFALAFLKLGQHQRPSLQKAQCYARISWLKISQLVPVPARQQLLLKPLLLRVRRAEEHWFADLPSLPGPWPAEFSAAVLTAVEQQFSHTTRFDVYHADGYHHRELARQLTELLSPGLAPADRPAAIARLEALPEAHFQFQPHLDRLIETLRFQQELDTPLDE